MTFKTIETSELKITNHMDRHIFHGVISQNFEPEWANQFDAEILIFDFEGIVLINSVGIMKFINFVKKLNPCQSIKYQNVQPVIVSQMSLVNGLINNRFQLETFYVPYISKDSDEQILILLNLSEVKNGKLPSKSHPVLKVRLEHDVNEDKFLNFLKF